MKKITGCQQFYTAIDKMKLDMSEFSKTQKEGFWASSIDHETLKSNCKPYSKNKNLWLGITEVNGGSKGGSTSGYDAPTVFMWRTIKCYMTGKSDEEIMKNSETKKVLHSENGYDFCLVRDHLRQPTDTCWGKKFIYDIEDKHYHHKMVIFKKDVKVFESFERWEFTNFCEGVVREETRNPETPTEIFRYFNPFKLLIVPFNDEKYKELSDERYGKSCHNSPHNVIKELEDRFGYKKTHEKLWIVHIMGMGKFSPLHFDRHITTWWIISSKDKPTHDEALVILMKELQIYDQEDFAELMVHFQNELVMNMNRINFLVEQRIMDLYQRKLITTLETLMDVRWKELRDFWNKNIIL